MQWSLVKSNVKSGNSKVGIYSPYGWLRWVVLPVQRLSSADLSYHVPSQIGPKTSLFAFYQPHCHSCNIRFAAILLPAGHSPIGHFNPRRSKQRPVVKRE